MRGGTTAPSEILYGELARSSRKRDESALDWHPQRLDPAQLNMEQHFVDADGWSGAGIFWMARTWSLPEEWALGYEPGEITPGQDMCVSIMNGLLQKAREENSTPCELSPADNGDPNSVTIRTLPERTQPEKAILTNAHRLMAVEELCVPGEWFLLEVADGREFIEELIYVDSDGLILGSVNIQADRHT